MNKIRIYGRYSFSALVLLIMLASGLQLAFAGMDDWAMFHHDPANTGYSTSSAPDTSKMLWSYTTGDSVSSPPAVADGKVYIGSWDDKVYCLDAGTGAHIWNYTTGYDVSSSPAVADGRVYVGSADYKVYCLDADTGAYVWSYTTGGYLSSSPAVVDDRVYVGSDDDKVYCLDAGTGAHIWNYTTGDWVSSSPAVADGRVYVGSNDNKTYCFGSSITQDDIMNELQALQSKLGDIEAEVDAIEAKLDDETRFTDDTELSDLEDKLTMMLNSILARLGPVGGLMLPKEELRYLLNMISENIEAVTLIVVSAIVFTLLTKRMK